MTTESPPRGLIATAVRRRLAVTMIYLAVGLFGLVAARRLPVDMFPDIEAPVMSVMTVWPGSSAQDVEEEVTDVIEDHLGALADLDEISSVSQDNISVVSLVYDFGTDLANAADDVRDALEFADRMLPDDVEDSRIMRLRASIMPVYMFGVTSRSSELGRYGDLIQDRIADPLGRVPGVGNVIAFNATGREVLIEVDPRALSARQLTLDVLAQSLVVSNLSMPAGYVEVGESEYVVRVPADLRSLSEIESLVVGRGQRGQPVRLGDVARVSLQSQEMRELAEVEGNQAVWLIVQKQSGANTVAVVDGVRAELARLVADLPADLEITELLDGSEFIVSMVENLTSAVIMGGIFVVVVVLVFLQRLGPSLIIALALPTCGLLVLLLMYLFGLSLNGISLMSMALAVGMVVDNAIVVLENIIRHIERGERPVQAAIKGPPEVAAAVVASTLTSVSIFAPLVFISGLVGEFFSEIAFVVISALVASLLTSLVLTPMLAGWWLRAGTTAAELRGWRRVTLSPFKLLSALYVRVLRVALRFRWLTLGLSVGLAVATVWLLRGVSADFTSRMDSGDIEITATVAEGTDVSRTFELGRRIAAVVEAQPEVTLVSEWAGESDTGFGIASGGAEGSHVVQVSAKLVPRSERADADYDVAERVRLEIEDWPEITSLSVQSGNPLARIIIGGGRPIVVRLLADREEDLRRAADQVIALLSGIEGVNNPSTSAFDSKPELRLEIDREAASELGVPVAAAASTIRTAVFGSEVTRVRLEGHDYPVRLRLADGHRERVSHIRELEVPSYLHTTVPLASIVNPVEGEALLQIRHQDRQRVAEVSADFYGRALGDIIIDLDRGLAEAELPAGVTHSYAGQIEQQKETYSDLALVLLLAVVLVFMVLAGQFESLVDPFVLMFSIPFAFTGTFLFLILAGAELTIFAFLGLIILMGIVVNNAIVLVDFINLLRRRGAEDLDTAIVEASESRLRPVLMTTLTTIAGMMPLALSTGMGSEMWRPIGIAVIGGLAVSSLVTLVLVPTMYRMLEVFRRGVRA